MNEGERKQETVFVEKEGRKEGGGWLECLLVTRVGWILNVMLTLSFLLEDALIHSQSLNNNQLAAFTKLVPTEAEMEALSPFKNAPPEVTDC